MANRPRRKTLKEKPKRRYGAKSGGQRKVANHKPKRYTLQEAQQFDAEIRRHIGKWIALVEDHVVAAGDTPAEAMEIANKSGYKRPVIIRAPMTNEEVVQIL